MFFKKNVMLLQTTKICVNRSKEDCDVLIAKGGSTPYNKEVCTIALVSPLFYTICMLWDQVHVFCLSL